MVVLAPQIGNRPILELHLLHFITDLYWMLEEVTAEQQNITTAVVDFVISETPCDIDILKRALYCQVK